LKTRPFAILITLFLTAATLPAADPVDLGMIGRIREEGFRHSQVMSLASDLTDGIGARLTGSPNARKANEWTRAKLEELGLKNAHLESWEFGRGWSYDAATARMTSPDVVQLSVFPTAWSPSTNGVIRGKVVKVKLEADADYEKQKGKLAGLIVLLGDAPEMKTQDKAALSRLDEKELAGIADYAIPGKPRSTKEEYLQRRNLRRRRLAFFAEEKVLLVIEGGRGPGGGTFNVQQSGSYKPGEDVGVPWVEMATEQYGRLARLADAGKNVEVEAEVRTRFYDDDPKQFNTIAEIPGTDKKDEVVMIGAHLDSWHAGTGATDNGAGVVAAMEAMRILQAIGVPPRRTIRIGLWTGEEQGLLGSQQYVVQHFGSRPEPTDPAEKDLPSSYRKPTGPFAAKPEQGKISAYFNLDNGTGKIRGIYAQSNAAVFPIFQAWLEPLKDLGATTVTMRDTGSTDHISFDSAGIPAFQFIQDPIEYDTRTHHTNVDTFERLQRDDLMQASVVMATFLWDAANRPELMPRKVLAK
jgi:carboxypeptidase Q